MTDCIRRIVKEVLGESKGKKHLDKETWWIIEVHKVIQEKKMMLQSLAGDWEYRKL